MTELENFFWQYKFNNNFAFDCVRYIVKESEVKLHWHSYCQIALCTDGYGVFKFENKTYPYQQGDLFIVDNTELHGAFVEKGKTAEFLFVMFCPDVVARNSDNAFEYEYLLPMLYKSNDFCNKISASTLVAQRITPLLLDLENENKIKRSFFHHLIHSKLCVILSELLVYYGKDENSKKIVDKHIKLRPAISYIEKHYKEPITLNDVAKQVYLSPSRFRHLFQEAMHITFKEYLIGLRYQNAVHLIRTTEMNISEIAEQCGFSNLNSFYKLFKYYEGKTPSKMRHND